MINILIYLSRFRFMDNFLMRLSYAYNQKLSIPGQKKAKLKLVAERSAQEHLETIVRREKKGIPVNVIAMPKRRGSR